MLKFFSVVDEVKAIGRFKLTLNKDTFSWTIKLVELLVASNYDVHGILIYVRHCNFEKGFGRT
uniref:Uncharacterized protein n=1 Tax=Geoglobus ahangari TaxID=113653 RepID=A0A7J3TIE3_9EURY